MTWWWWLKINLGENMHMLLTQGWISDNFCVVAVQSSCCRIHSESVCVFPRSLCVDALIELSDDNADWKLSFDEFLNCLKPGFNPPEKSMHKALLEFHTQSWHLVNSGKQYWILFCGNQYWETGWMSIKYNVNEAITVNRNRYMSVGCLSSHIMGLKLCIRLITIIAMLVMLAWLATAVLVLTS